MNDFVEECRREWKRLGVPDPPAEEMAADLAADLNDASAEGVSAQELLGDPRSFAAAWAAERGVVPPARRRRRPRFLVAFTAFAATALVVSALLLATGEPKVSLVAQRTGPAGGVVQGRVASASAATPIEWILLALAIVALAFAGWQWSSWGRSRPAATA